MDIRCPSCSTVYEFDESRIGPDGINLRCSACGQVFRVRAAARPAESGWTVRHAGRGDETHFDDLASVQRWIVEKRLDRNDLISRSGENWRRLEDVQELATFFQVVDELPDDPITNPRLERPDIDFDAPLGAPTLTIPQGSGLGGRVDPNATLRADARHIPALDLAPMAAAPVGRTPQTTLEGAGAPAVGSTGKRPPAPTPNPALPQAPPPPINTAAMHASEVGAHIQTAPSTAPAAKPAVVKPPEPQAPPAAAPTAARARGMSALSETDLSSAQTGRSVAVSGEGYALGAPRKKVDSDAFFMDARDANDSDAWKVGDAPIATRSEPGDGYVPMDTASVAAVQRPGGWIVKALAAIALVLVGALIGVFIIDPGRFGMGEDETTPASAAAPNDDDDPNLVVAPSTDPVTEQDDEPGIAPDAVAAADTPAEQAPAEAAAGLAAEVAAEAHQAAEAAPEPEPEPEPEPAPEREAERPAAPRSVSSMSFDDQMNTGRAALDGGNLERALEAYSAAADSSGRAEAHVGVARTYERMGRHDLAAARYERATASNGRYQPAWLGLAATRARIGDRAGAETAYRRVIEIRDTGSAADDARAGLRALGVTP